MNIYLLRHGESIGNKNRVFLGHTDLDLSDKGYLQAKKTAQYIKANIKIDEIYSSDLKRAYNTANETAKLLNLDITKNNQLREIYAGDWENNHSSYNSERYKETYRLWTESLGLARCDNGESTVEVQERVYKAINDIVSKTQKENILIVTHYTPIVSLTAKILNLPAEKMHTVDYPPNTSLTKIIYENNKFTLDYFGKSEHLEELNTHYKRV